MANKKLGNGIAGLRELTIKNLQSEVEFMVKSRVAAVAEGNIRYNVPLFLWGMPGIAKSDVIAFVARKNNWGFHDLRLAQIDPSDIRGVPYYNEKTGKADFQYYESVLPPSDTLQPGILLLDELPLAPDMVQSASYQLINDRKVGNYSLPINYVIIAAGNPDAAGGTYFEMSGALKNRFNHANMAIDHEGWVRWMVGQGYDETIVGYLAYNVRADKEKLYNYEPERFVFPTFRSWEKAAQAIRYGKDHIQAISDSVGQAIATDYEVFKQLTKDIPDAAVLVAKGIYYEEVEKQLVASQKVGNCLLKKDIRQKMTDDEKFSYFRYFLDMRNPKDADDKREELTVLFLVNIENEFEILDEVDKGFQRALKAKTFKIPKDWLVDEDGKARKVPADIYEVINANFDTLRNLQQ